MKVKKGSATLTDLIQEREAVRAKEKQLTQDIKAQRRKEVEERNNAPKTETSTYTRIKSENQKLRGLIVLHGRSQGDTFKMIGEMLGCSGTRARQIMERQYRDLLKIKGDE